MTIVLVPIILASALFLYLTAEKSDGHGSKEKYITLVAYQESEEMKERSDVVDEVLLDCQQDSKRCQEVEEALASSSCPPASNNPRILVSSNQGERGMVSADCPAYAALEKVFLAVEA